VPLHARELMLDLCFQMARSLCLALVLAGLLRLQAGTIYYSIVDLGVLSGGSTSTANAISSNGRVAGSSDNATAASVPFAWTAGSGVTAVSVVNSQFAFGNGINASGAVVGTEYNSDLGVFRAFQSNGGTASYIALLGAGTNNSALGINDSGVVAGYSETSAGGAEQAYSYSAGTVTSLGTLSGGTTSRANAINNSGQIAGQSDSGSDSNLHPAVWTSGGWTDLGLAPGYQSGVASAISNAGGVAGTFSDGVGGSMAFLWTSTTGTTLLGSLTAGGDSQAYGVNSAAQVVGTADNVAFLYMNSTMYDLNSLLDPTVTGWQLTEALAINDSGQIVGSGLYDGQQRAFVLSLESSSVPEPLTWWMAAGGLLLIVGYKFRLGTRSPGGGNAGLSQMVAPGSR